MGQCDVLQLLKKAGKPMSANEIEQKLKISRSPINNSLKRLYEQNYIDRMIVNQKDRKGARDVFYYYIVETRLPKGLKR
jgi:predicted transcriptional regulator